MFSRCHIGVTKKREDAMAKMLGWFIGLFMRSASDDDGGVNHSYLHS